MRACVTFAALLMFGCGDNLAVTADAMPDGPPAFAEATHDTAPTVVSGGGTVLAAPKVQPNFYMGDSDMQAQVEQFVGELGASSYWATETSEYGVGAIAALPTIVSTDTPPTEAGLI